MKRITLLMILSASLGMSACSKFLEERSMTDIVPTKVQDFGDILQTDGYPKSDFLQPQLVLMDDDIEFYISASFDLPEAYQLNAAAFQWQPNFIEACKLAGSPDEIKFDSWTTYYKRLLNVNTVLQYIDAATGREADRESFKGQAYALRAYYYYMLVNMYALPYRNDLSAPDKTPGVPLKLDANVVERSIPRNTVAEVYDRIDRDLDSAILLLEKNKTSGNPLLIDHVAAHFLAARVALFKEDWQAVVTHSDYVLQYHPTLMDFNEGTNVQLVSKASPETIWAFGRTSETGAVGVTTLADVSHDLVNTFESTDLRRETMFMTIPPDLSPYFATDYGVMKYIDDRDCLTWRSAEVYLNRAEALIQLYREKGDAGNGQKALDDLNTLRAKRFAPADFVAWTMKPGDELLKMCREERRRELFMEEGHRWFDLRRYGMPSIQHIYRPAVGVTQVFVLQHNDPQYTLPVPNEVLDRNTGLTQITQLTSPRQPQ